MTLWFSLHYSSVMFFMLFSCPKSSALLSNSAHSSLLASVGIPLKTLAWIGTKLNRAYIYVAATSCIRPLLLLSSLLFQNLDCRFLGAGTYPLCL